jgi:hypothetical protein
MTEENLKVVVKVVLAGLSPNYGFTDIESSYTLQSLGLQDEAAIAELKTGIYRAISGQSVKVDFNAFYQAIPVTINSTFDQLLVSVLSALPGDDPTKPK